MRALGHQGMKHKKFLKVYLWSMALLFLGTFWLELTDDEPSDIVDYLDYVFWLTALLGVFGYCYCKKIFANAFWKLYLPFIVIWDSFVIFRVICSDAELQKPELLAVFMVVYIIVLLPEYVVIYLYGYKN